jgi:hypothetical protein
MLSTTAPQYEQVCGIFSWYVANCYNKTYGSLGAIIGFMTWMWVSIIVVLVGAKLNAELEIGAQPRPALHCRFPFELIYVTPYPVNVRDGWVCPR